MTLNEALRQKTENRINAIEKSEEKRRELEKLIPELAKLNAQLAAIPMRALEGASVQQLKSETELVRAEKQRLLTSRGFAPDEDEPKFECPLCNDGGYCGLKLCDCIKKMISSETYVESVLGKGLSGKSFDSFLLDYYKGDSFENAKRILSLCKKYSSEFPSPLGGLLLTGGTGLGKTHLSAAIASEVAKKGFFVVYESAQQIFDAYDQIRFGRAAHEEKQKYEQCDLLIIDDLGAECIGSYSVAQFSNLINLRMVSGRHTVISTNLTPAQISKTYGERVFSRLMGEFLVLAFKGSDVRMQKLKGDRQ